MLDITQTGGCPLPSDDPVVTLADLLVNDAENLGHRSREERMRDTAPIPERVPVGELELKVDATTLSELLRFGVEWNEVRDFLHWLTLPSVGAYSPGGFARHLAREGQLSLAVRQYRQWQHARSCQ